MVRVYHHYAVYCSPSCGGCTAAFYANVFSGTGRVLLRHPLLAENFAAPGSPIKQHDLLALVKVGALYLPVRSPVAGRLVSFHVSEGDAVEFGQEIAKIQSDDSFLSGL